MKLSKKVSSALDRRVRDFDTVMDKDEKDRGGFQKPGSRNRKKGAGVVPAKSSKGPGRYRRKR